MNLYVGISMQIWFASSINTLLIFVLHVENGAKSLNATSALFLSLSPVFTVISPVTKINTSE